MSPIASTLPAQLLSKYRYSCAYCHRSIGLSDHVFFESDHIQPASKNGADSLENRAPACRECNRRKSNKTKWKDPETERIVSLFNPVKDIWNEHFTVSDISGVIIGKSPKGRATVNLLGLDTQPRNEIDLFKGNTIVSLDDRELLSQICLLRYLRLSCDYGNVINLGWLLFNDERTMSSKIRLEIQKVIAIQIVETFFTRSRNIEEIFTGIRWATYFKKYFSQLSPNETIHTKIFDHFVTTFSKQLVSLGHQHSRLLKNIIRASLAETTEENFFAKLSSNLAWRLKLGDQGAESDLRLLFNQLEYLHEFSQVDPVKSIYVLIDVLDIFSLVPDFFSSKSDCIVENTIKTNNLVKKHFAFDITLFSLLQRRMLALKMDYDLSRETLTKSELLSYASKHGLFNEIRQIKTIS